MDNLSNVKHTANTVAIGNKVIGENEPCFIIAEIGINQIGFGANIISSTILVIKSFRPPRLFVIPGSR